MTDWRPGTPVAVLRQRAALLAAIRAFFADRGVLEVETPLLAATTASDVHIHSFQVTAAENEPPLYLQTSPEYAMKRLLGDGSGAIYQVCKAFRQDESGRHHNREFSLLEWYRPGFTMAALMDEVQELMALTLGIDNIARKSYRELFDERLGIDPHRVDAATLQALAESRMELSGAALQATDYLQLLMSQCIEPELPAACFVYDYPVAQAALARIETDGLGQPVARRFELYCQGLELANGYHELCDEAEQRRRFEADLLRRRELGLPQYSPDEKLLAALAAGLPDCAGVALGLDRLLMLVCGAGHIDEVISFPAGRC